jgi:hypothetical protein
MTKLIAKRLSLAAVLVLGVASLFSTAEAKTKSNPAVEVTIPYSFHLANRTLPAGNYKFELATGTPAAGDSVSVLVVRNREAKIYQAVAVTVQPGAGLTNESRVDFSGNNDHMLVSVWKNGDRFDLQPALATYDGDDRNGGAQLIPVAARLSEK